ncbi:MAG TPA: carbon-nitrogen hydrolase family protein [Rhodocyclaceae bacterium]|nr:carbon-nitrogen hydrolase family protein [Rhodocyclaceae bacterium]
MKIAAIQMTSGPEVGPNLESAGKLIAEAAAQGAQLVALPEYFPFIGASDEARFAAREQFGGDEKTAPIQHFLSSTARENGVWVIGGSLPLDCGDSSKLLNTCLVYNDRGEHVARYDKIHLFAFKKGTEEYNEARTIKPGEAVVAFDSPFGRIGLGICYDLRFPELFRQAGKEKRIDLFILPAAFTETTGKAHWEILLRARAIENLCYVMAPAQGGRHPTGRMTHGNSMIIDPWGEVLARLDKEVGIIVADITPERIAKVRANLPALEHAVLLKH